jgi:hypothetical protein
MRHSRVQVHGILLLLLLGTACKKSDSGNPQSAANPAAPANQAAPATQPAPATQAAAPAAPPPPFSAAQKIGMFAYPKNNQSNDQQLRDEYDCYTTVQQQTGINPDTPPPSGPSAAEVQAAQQQAAENAPEAKGGRARGAAKGAVGGAVVGGIAGNAGALALCAVDESSARLTRRQNNRQLSRRAHKCSSKPIKPRPHTTSKWIPSREGSRLAWTHAGIRSNSFGALSQTGETACGASF